jgi:hypothetical protein
MNVGKFETRFSTYMAPMAFISVPYPNTPSPAELRTIPSTSSALQADELMALFNRTKLDEDHIDLTVMKPCIEHERSTETFRWVE